MIKRRLCIFLCLLLVLGGFPGELLAVTFGDVTQNLPVESHLESVEEVTAINTQLTTQEGSAVLSQDKVQGNYGIKVTVGDVPNEASVEYDLVTSDAFDVSEYSQVRLWVKPGAGAKWIQFLTNSVVILGGSGSDGEFKVGDRPGERKVERGETGPDKDPDHDK